MPIPPCLIRLDRFKWVQFGFCSTGTESPNLTIDPLGNVRSCNLSSHLLGNINRDTWSEIHARIQEYQGEFQRDVPEICKGCAYERSCQGGCKESAFATFGEVHHPEPFLFMALNPNWRELIGWAPECPGANMGTQAHA